MSYREAIDFGKKFKLFDEQWQPEGRGCNRMTTGPK